MEINLLSPEVAQKAVASNAQSIRAEEIENTFGPRSVDLVSKALGSEVLAFSDEWFAAAENLINPKPPIRQAGKFTYAGAWYDGWETRRHNPEPFDWVVFRLGVASGKIMGVEVDTAFFNGNHAPEVIVQGCFARNNEEVKSKEFSGWEEILSKQECGPSARHAWLLHTPTEKAYTHVRLLMIPDGGIARFRLYGSVVPVFPESTGESFDLAATVNGGVAISCSDQHFGTKDNLLLPGRGIDMGDGWETKRTRGEHVDWAIIRLGAPGHVLKLVVDTAHFRGNFPQKVQVFGGNFPRDPTPDTSEWMEILAPQKTGADKEHEYGHSVLQGIEGKVFTHMKLVMIPDGGIKRFRVFGTRSIQTE